MSRRGNKLTPPLSWEERRPIFCDQVFYIPDYFEGHSDYALPEQEELFGAARPLSIEFCSGNGQWILERAASQPERNWIAVEWQFDRVSKIWSKCKGRGLKNLIIICGDARLFVDYYLPPKAVEEAFVNFPDPWPKRRHAKNRLIQSPFLRSLHRGLAPRGLLRLVTDDPPYRDQMVRELLSERLYSPLLEPPYYVTDCADYGTSYFDALWRSHGRTIHHLFFQSNP